MQCPTCGANAPGTPGTCPNCGTALGGREHAPLGAPVGDALDGTMVVPPPTPAWASAEPVAVDPESTAAWTFDPDDDADEPAPQQQNGFASPPPSWHEAPAGGFGAEPESIVPDSWYAKPRRPESAPEQPPQPEQWTPQHLAPDDRTAMQPPPQQDQWAPRHLAQDDRTMMQPPQQEQWSPQPPMQNGMPPGQFGPGGPPMGGPPFGQPMGQPPMGGDMFGSGPGFPPPDAPRGSGGVHKGLLVGVSALVTVAVVAVGFVLWPKGEDKTPNAKASHSPNGNKPVAQKRPLSGEAREQAKQVNALLDDSAGTRRILGAALGGTRKCETLPAAVNGFKQVAQSRQNQLRRTKELELDKTPNGERMRGHLQQAFQASLDVDLALQAWAQRVQSGCKGKPKPDASKAPGRAAAERRATVAKQRFVVLWNPVAKKTGQPARRWNGV
ncbi:hypothetical protein [Actinomadura macrotermitis]|uniref:hypothetical protein n=1 Tax=Actinomadura macrotermitis TaxID=2585200 RepID=UPI001295E575|nr:hypothetical protein [Actinomadura macrotermitis]